MDIAKTSCQNFAEALQLATDQRYAHEYGDTAVTEAPEAEGQNELSEEDGCSANSSDCREMFAGKVSSYTPSRSDIRGSEWTSEQKPAESRLQDACGETKFGEVSFSAKSRKTPSSSLLTAPVTDREDLRE